MFMYVHGQQDMDTEVMFMDSKKPVHARLCRLTFSMKMFDYFKQLYESIKFSLTCSILLAGTSWTYKALAFTNSPVFRRPDNGNGLVWRNSTLTYKKKKKKRRKQKKNIRNKMNLYEISFATTVIIMMMKAHTFGR